jgi:hypothetical protein
MLKTILAVIGGISCGLFAGTATVIGVLKYEKQIKARLRVRAVALQKFAEQR